jgi:hypothetical protein
LKHAKVLRSKERRDYQKKLVFHSIDDRLLELTEGFPLLEQTGARCVFETALERTRIDYFSPAIGTCLLVADSLDAAELLFLYLSFYSSQTHPGTPAPHTVAA